MRWIAQQADPQAVHDLEEELGLLPAVATAVALRGKTIVEDAERFLQPRLSQVTDPFRVPGLRACAERILRAIDNRDSISICGDYDVDGITATTILVSFLRDYHLKPRYFIPRRKTEGYGMSRAMVDRMLACGQPKLVIALDCGTNAVQEIRYLRSRGCEVIVIDHHRTLESDSVSPADILVNPNSSRASAPEYSPLCSAGLVFKVVHGVVKILRSRGDKHALQMNLREYLDLVAMGTITDISPLVDENRIMVWFGLRQMRQTKRQGILAILQASKVGGRAEIVPTDISRRIGPRINASGRLADAALPVEMLLSNSASHCRELALQLCEMNAARQEIERRVFEEAKQQIADLGYEGKKGILAAGNWHTGVVGIVAGRLARIYNKPCIVLGFEGEYAKGSGRSVKGVNLLELLKKIPQDSLETWGGHPMATGITAYRNKVEQLRKDFEAALENYIQAPECNYVPDEKIQIVKWLDKKDITLELFDQVTRMSPFGEGNPEPVFGLSNIPVPQMVVFPSFSSQKIDSFRFEVETEPGVKVTFSGHGMKILPTVGQRVDMAIKLSFSYYNGNRYPKVDVVDWRSC
ncbi:MAG: single-stranded-DNA-specific exonuclease RecJ [Opitutales bacterium]|nr:single-stranded-DNA-specific exonuclease RecJ [Opitutales bacterium]